MQAKTVWKVKKSLVRNPEDMFCHVEAQLMHFGLISGTYKVNDKLCTHGKCTKEERNVHVSNFLHCMWLNPLQVAA